MKTNVFSTIRFFAFVTLMVFLFAPLGWAVTYYVDCDSGNDSNAGTATDQAWLTISKVNSSSFRAGDNIYLKKGCTFREQLNVRSSGSASGAITFSSYGSGAAPIISGADLKTSEWTLQTTNVWKASITTEPTVVIFNTTPGIKASSLVSVNSTNKWYWASNVLYVYSTSNPTSAFRSPGIQVGKRNVAVAATGNSYVMFDGLHVQAGNHAEGAQFFFTDVTGFIVQNCEISFGNYGVIFTGTTGNSNTVKNNTIHDNRWYGIHSGAGDKGPRLGAENLFQDNTIYNNGYGGVSIEANYWIVEGNTIYNNGTNTSTTLHNAVHTYAQNASSGTGLNIIIRYNKIYNNKGTNEEGAGIALDQWCDNTQVYYNVIYGNDGPGIYIYDATGVVVYNNTLYGNMINTFGDGDERGEIRITSSILDRTNNTTVKNNIVRATGANVYAIHIDGHVCDSILNITNNIWYATQANWYFFNGGGNNLTTWNALNGIGADLNSDPLFVNPTAVPPDFHLQSTSPAIDAGVNVGLTADYAGVTVPQDTGYDIGAYEYYNGSTKLKAPSGLRVLP